MDSSDDRERVVRELAESVIAIDGRERGYPPLDWIRGTLCGALAEAFDAGHAAGERKGAADERAETLALLCSECRPIIESGAHRPEPAPGEGD